MEQSRGSSQNQILYLKESFRTRDLVQRIAASATGGDNVKSFEEVVPDYSAMGYRQFELYATGRGASPDYNKGVTYYANEANKYIREALQFLKQYDK